MNIIILGFDGYAKSVIDSLLSTKQYENVIALADSNLLGDTFGSVKVEGTFEDMKSFYENGYRLIHVANEDDMQWRKDISERAREIGFSFGTIIDPTAQIARDVQIGEGVYISKNVVIEPLTTIEDNTILNVGVIIQSGCRVGELTRISTAATICEGSTVGKMCYVGAKSVVTEGTVVPDNTQIEDVSVYGKQPFEE